MTTMKNIVSRLSAGHLWITELTILCAIISFFYSHVWLWNLLATTGCLLLGVVTANKLQSRYFYVLFYVIFLFLLYLVADFITYGVTSFSTIVAYFLFL